MKVEIK